jgi:dolichol-phosphate mannosyltransferase
MAVRPITSACRHPRNTAGTAFCVRSKGQAAMNMILPSMRTVDEDRPVDLRFAVEHMVCGPELTVVVPTLNERANILPLVERLHRALQGIHWEVIFVDDDSRDGTVSTIRELAARDHHVRAMRRISRHGLAGACLEGILASSAPIVAVMDADLQHDETCLAEMLAILRRQEADLVVASRYTGEGSTGDGLTRLRRAGSRLAVRIAQSMLAIRLSDPMSGFFMLRRPIVDAIAPRLSQQGFKILLDIVATAPKSIRTREISYRFKPRLHGESKLDGSVVLEYLGLVVTKATGDLISARLLAFGLVGSLGMLVHLAILKALLVADLPFATAQTSAMLTAMTLNYTLNNAFTYRDRRRHGWHFVSGLAMFAALCSFGILAGVGVSTLLYAHQPRWWVAGLAGAVLGAGWNYVTNSAITWRAR